MPAVKMVPIKNDEGVVVANYFEPSKSFSESVARNRVAMTRPDGKTVNVNKKLQKRGHYDDRHGFTMGTSVKTETLTIASNKERVK